MSSETSSPWPGGRQERQRCGCATVSTQRDDLRTRIQGRCSASQGGASSRNPSCPRQRPRSPGKFWRASEGRITSSRCRPWWVEHRDGHKRDRRQSPLGVDALIKASDGLRRRFLPPPAEEVGRFAQARRERGAHNAPSGARSHRHARFQDPAHREDYATRCHLRRSAAARDGQRRRRDALEHAL